MIQMKHFISFNWLLFWIYTQNMLFYAIITNKMIHKGEFVSNKGTL
jgi:hypothetical protein